MVIYRQAYCLRNILISPLLIFASLSFFHETEMDELLWPLGIFVFLLGFMIRIWAQQHLHYRLNVKKHLTTTGPYSFMRNPIYIGNILICLGSVVISELLWLVPIAFFYSFGIYSLAVRYEEGHLLEKYGEPYRRYMSEVPRWFPNTIRLKKLWIKNEYFRASIMVEIHCTLTLLPYFVKEIISNII